MTVGSTLAHMTAPELRPVTPLQVQQLQALFMARDRRYAKHWHDYCNEIARLPVRQRPGTVADQQGALKFTNAGERQRHVAVFHAGRDYAPMPERAESWGKIALGGRFLLKEGRQIDSGRCPGLHSTCRLVLEQGTGRLSAMHRAPMCAHGDWCLAWRRSLAPGEADAVKFAHTGRVFKIIHPEGGDHHMVEVLAHIHAWHPDSTARARTSFHPLPST
mmetsp:Transcript_30026/g.89061  ORF Transcript_30026/g.89061 Transcript_30026/m.89061 type:complete len:218 (-) Transcript_30026:293-946(-)|eukprot:359676-Chlamydomonas_euryale.AAC.2